MVKMIRRFEFQKPYVVKNISKSFLATLLMQSVFARRWLDEKFSLTADFGEEGHLRIAFDYVRSVEFYELETPPPPQRRIRVVLGVDLTDWFKEALLLIYPDEKRIAGNISFFPYEMQARLKGALPDINGLKEAVGLILSDNLSETRWTNISLRDELNRQTSPLRLAPDGGVVLLEQMELLNIAKKVGEGTWVAAINQRAFRERFHDQLPEIR